MLSFFTAQGPGLLPRLLRALCLAGCALLLGACAPARRDAHPAGVPRADPGLTRWMERQSVLGMAPELAAIVSGSPLGWRETARLQGGGAHPLLQSADIWLHVAPRSLLTRERQAALVELARPQWLGTLAGLGIRGIFVAPAHAGGAFWHDGRLSGEAGADAVSLLFAEHVGTDADFNALAAQAGQHGMHLGGDILPAASGLGPDFMLATLHARDYPGAWMMTDIPKTLWPTLPPKGALAPDALDALARAGLVPPALYRDAPPALSLPAGGWAVTEEVRGADGVVRRWVYRYDRTPERPVLHWDDPSATARRMFSASIIREVGVLRQPLVGLHLAPLFGLDRPERAAPQDVSARRKLEPGLAAVTGLSREIARYGGYGLVREPLPLALTQAMLDAGADFALDATTFPFAEHALLTGDATALRAACDAALAARLPQGRVVRPMSREEGIPALLLPEPQRTAFVTALRASGLPFTQVDQVWFASIPALAAARLGVPAADAPPQAAQRAAIASAHTALLAFRAGLPGMVWLSGQDLRGVTFADPTFADDQQMSLPAWSPDPIAPGTARQAASRAGIGAGTALYDTTGEGPFGDALRALSAMRATLGLAGADCAARPATSAPGSVAMTSRLPGGDYLTVVANFGHQTVTETLALPGGPATRLLGHADSIADEGRRVTLPPLAWVWLRHAARP